MSTVRLPRWAVCSPALACARDQRCRAARGAAADGPHSPPPLLAAAAHWPPCLPISCPQSGRLSVTGSATVSVSPDVAKVFLSIQVSKPTVREAGLA